MDALDPAQLDVRCGGRPGDQGDGSPFEVLARDELECFGYELDDLRLDDDADVEIRHDVLESTAEALINARAVGTMAPLSDEVIHELEDAFGVATPVARPS